MCELLAKAQSELSAESKLLAEYTSEFGRSAKTIYELKAELNKRKSQGLAQSASLAVKKSSTTDPSGSYRVLLGDRHLDEGALESLVSRLRPNEASHADGRRQEARGLWGGEISNTSRWIARRVQG